jgi:tetratricopeptide (TPR) repeat protein
VTAPPPSAARLRTPLAAGLIGLAGLAVYFRTWSDPFVFDDVASIVLNPTIRHLGRWPGALLTPGLGATVQGRPVLNLSFALNYAFGGTNPAGYRAANVAIHVLAGWTLFGIVRRTVAGRRGEAMAGVVALLWVIHPLQTEAVTYVVQRAESLLGLFYLLTLYCFIRYANGEAASRPAAAPGRRGWAALSVLACLLGVGTKEVIVSAPLIVLAYDRTFIAGTLREAWRRRWRYYLALAATWLPLAGLVAHAGDRGGTSAAGSGVTLAQYAPTQFAAVARYLRLAVWPRPLIFDYGAQWVTSARSVLLPALVVGAFAAATLWALRRRPALGFLGLAFFAILAPTSLVPGNRQTIAEHRMYLPLAAVLVALVLAAEQLAQRASARPRRRRGLLGGAAAAAVLVWGGFAAARNNVYASALALYGDTIAHRPDNPYAHSNYGYALGQSGQTAAAIAQFQEALRLKPDFADAHYNLGLILVRTGHAAEGVQEYEQALSLRPAYPEALYNLGITLAAERRLPEAIARFAALVQLQPAFADGHIGLGNALVQAGQVPEGVHQLEESLLLNGDSAKGRYALGRMLADAGLMPLALAQFEAAVRLDPNDPEAQLDLGNVLLALGRTPEAIARYAAALRLRPDYPQAQHNLLYAQRLP